jgi:diguanylate cyclase (GGDEF)-like protein
MQRLCSLHRQLTSLTDQLKASNADLQIQSLHDPLTGLTNRRGLDIRLDEELRIARRERQPLTLILCDVDNFKSYNDTAGHLQGDQCLVRIAQLLGETCRRPRDLAARFGGEEFVILMPGTSHSGAMFYAKGLQRMVHQLALPHPASDGKTCVTLSGGITTCVPDGTTTIESLLCAPTRRSTPPSRWAATASSASRRRPTPAPARPSWRTTTARRAAPLF